MIAAWNRWYAGLTALLLLAPAAYPAGGLESAAATLARKTAAFTGKDEAIAISYRNISSLGSAQLAQVRGAFESALRDSGSRPSDSAAAAEARISLSENASQYLLVEEARRGEERQVWIEAWDRAETPKTQAGISLDRKQVWRQADAILDIAFLPGGMLVLSPSGLSLYARAGDRWDLRQSAPLTPLKPWPRDLRGRIHANGPAFQVFLPGMACAGNVAPELSLQCHASDAPWVLESGSRALLLANFASTRNYFDGRIVTQSGAHKTIAPFYSAASAESQGRTFWLMPQIDGQTSITDGSFDALGSTALWGSDIVGIDAPAACGAASQIFASRAGDAAETDALQSYAIVDGVPAPVSAPVLFSGPVTALWPSGGAAALAVARDLASGEYVAYVVTISCGN